MTTKELIEALQKEDPSGNLDVTVGKTPIHFVEQIQAYYDGCLEKLVQDKTNPYYNIVGGIITSRGNHVDIHTLSLQDAIFEDPNLPVTFDMDGDTRIAWYKKDVEDWRTRAMAIHEEVDIECMEGKIGRFAEKCRCNCDQCFEEQHDCGSIACNKTPKIIHCTNCNSEEHSTGDVVCNFPRKVNKNEIIKPKEVKQSFLDKLLNRLHVW